MIAFFTSFEFYLALFGIVGLLTATRFVARASFEWVLLAVNLIFLSFVANFAINVEVALFVIAVFVFICAKIIRETQFKRTALYSSIGLVLAILGIAKYHLVAEAPGFAELAAGFAAAFNLKRPIALLGISYFSFKSIHFVVDVYQGAIEEFSFLKFFNFLFFFPTFLSGPIDRYQNFAESNIEAKNLRLRSQEDWFKTFGRLALGLFKKQVIARSLEIYSVSAMSAGSLSGSSWLALMLGTYAYTAYIYFDFSGYSDLAIATARALGFTVPENFNSPLVSKSIQEYWTRWHITLSEWIRDYIFFPTQRFLLTVAPNLTGYTIPVISIMFAFTLCGIWHGDSVRFFVFGLLQGLALAINMKYSGEMKKRFKKDYRVWKELSWYKLSAAFFTLTFASLANVLFCDTGFTILRLIFWRF